MGVKVYTMNNNITKFKENHYNFTESLKKQEEKKLPVFKKRFKPYNPDQITFYIILLKTRHSAYQKFVRPQIYKNNNGIFTCCRYKNC